MKIRAIESTLKNPSKKEPRSESSSKYPVYFERTTLRPVLLSAWKIGMCRGVKGSDKKKTGMHGNSRINPVITDDQSVSSPSVERK